MSMNSWVVSAIIRASSNVPEIMAAATRATMGTNAAIERQNIALRSNAAQQAALRGQIQRTKAVQSILTAGFTTLAVVSGAAIYTGVKGAADLQNAMMSVAVATGRATNHMQDFYNMAFRVSGMTAQSVTTIAQEIAMAASSGLNDPRQLKTAFPRIAKAADVMWLSPKHLDPVQSVKQMSTLAHLFGAYSGTPLQHMLDRATQMMFVQPESLQAMIAQGRMFIPAALSRGVSEEDIWKSSMTMGQTGFLKSRGGSGLARVIEYLGGASALTGHLSKRQDAAMRTLGLVNAKGQLQFEDRKGHLLLGKAVDHLEVLSKRFNPVDFGNLLTNAFLAQGGRYMAAILRPSVYEKTQQNWKQMSAIGNVDTLWGKYVNTFWYQWNVFATNFANITKTIFLPLLPAFTRVFAAAGAGLGKAVMYLSQHQKLAKALGVGIMGTFIVSLGGIVATSLVAAANIWRLNAALDALSLSSRGGIAAGAVARGGGLGGLWSRLTRLGAEPATGALYPEVAALMERAGILRILASIASKAVPIVGWIALAASAINLLPKVFQALPNLLTTIHNWWTNNRAAIGYTVGFAFGAIGRMIQSAIVALIGAAQSAVGTLAQNWYLLAMPGGQAMMNAKMAIAEQAAMKQWSSKQTEGFGGAFQRGLYGGQSGQGYAPYGFTGSAPKTLTINNPVYHFGPGTARDHAAQFNRELDKLFNSPLSGSRTTGNLGTHPKVSRFSFAH